MVGECCAEDEVLHGCRYEYTPHWLQFQISTFKLLSSCLQSLEFVVKTKILMEMNIENRGGKIFPWGKNRQAYFFSLKIKMMDL